jgi:hypothetical protein
MYVRGYLQGSENGRVFTIELHMAYDIPTRFHKVWSRHLRETCRTKIDAEAGSRKNNNNNNKKLIWYK